VAAWHNGLFVATGVVWIVLERRQGRQDRPEATKVGRGGGTQSLVLTVGLGYVAAFALARLVPAAAIHPAWFAAWVGLILLWCGIGLRVWSFRTLGQYFTFILATSADQPVVTSGPYRIVRHPSYLGLLLAFTGVALAMGNWLSVLAIVGATLVALVHRIGIEERALTATLGDSYRAYAAARKRLVPFIW
jgi:protein-S-isoprenylcysteine O-methyltransferase Ste14